MQKSELVLRMIECLFDPESESAPKLSDCVLLYQALRDEEREKALYAGRKVLRSEEEQIPSAWVPTNEALPKEDTDVLCLEAIRDRAVFTGYREGSEWYDSDGDILCYPVTHWLPIPELPDTEREGSESAECT